MSFSCYRAKPELCCLRKEAIGKTTSSHADNICLLKLQASREEKVWPGWLGLAAAAAFVCAWWRVLWIHTYSVRSEKRDAGVDFTTTTSHWLPVNEISSSIHSWNVWWGDGWGSICNKLSCTFVTKLKQCLLTCVFSEMTRQHVWQRQTVLCTVLAFGSCCVNLYECHCQKPEYRGLQVVWGQETSPIHLSGVCQVSRVWDSKCVCVCLR